MKKPWESEKVWLAVIGLAALVTAGALGVVQVAGIDIVGIVGALILGRAWEGAAASAGPTAATTTNTNIADGGAK